MSLANLIKRVRRLYNDHPVRMPPKFAIKSCEAAFLALDEYLPHRPGVQP
jgi:hypothetical protein